MLLQSLAQNNVHDCSDQRDNNMFFQAAADTHYHCTSNFVTRTIKIAFSCLGFIVVGF